MRRTQAEFLCACVSGHKCKDHISNGRKSESIFLSSRKVSVTRSCYKFVNGTVIVTVIAVLLTKQFPNLF